MPKALPHLKEVARRFYLEGHPPKKIAQALGVSPSTVKNWIVDLPKHSTGFSQRQYGTHAARVARLTGRVGEAIRQEMEQKGNDACFFCGSGVYDKHGWFAPVFHHEDDGTVDRAHSACNAVRRHQAITKV